MLQVKWLSRKHKLILYYLIMYIQIYYRYIYILQTYILQIYITDRYSGFILCVVFMFQNDISSMSSISCIVIVISGAPSEIWLGADVGGLRPDPSSPSQRVDQQIHPGQRLYHRCRHRRCPGMLLAVSSSGAIYVILGRVFCYYEDERSDMSRMSILLNYWCNMHVCVCI